VTTVTEEPHAAPSSASHDAAPRSGPILMLWVALTVALQGVMWGAGFREYGLAEAIESGAAKIETRGVGELSDDVVRKAIRTQQDTRPFWTTLALIGDFALEPLSLLVRAAAVAVAFSCLAALVGRPVRFWHALAGCAALQGIWVVGLGVRVALAVALRTTDVETSLALAVPPGHYSAAAWAALRQGDAFALVGWLGLARDGWRRGQVNLFTALLVCAVLWAGESTLRVAGELMMGTGMRLTLIPE
jgi:hypothetical protein